MQFFRYLFLISLLFCTACGPAETEAEKTDADAAYGEDDDRAVDADGVDPTGFVAHYWSTWDNPHIHFDDGAGWTEPPGVSMTSEEGNWYVYRHTVWNGSVEFVFSDGADRWDNNDEQNYTADTREFWVRDGTVFQTQPDDAVSDDDVLPEMDDDGMDADTVPDDDTADDVDEIPDSDTVVFDDTVMDCFDDTTTVSVSGDDLRTWTFTTTADLRNNVPASKQRTVTEQTDGLRLHSDNRMFDALFAMAVEEVRENSVEQINDWGFNNGNDVPCSCFETGAEWHYVWTRDTAYSAFLSLGLVAPERTANSLLFKLSDRKSSVGGGMPEVVQDTGSGGSWPVSTDRVSWFFGAGETLPNLPDTRRNDFRQRMYQAAVNTVETDRQHVYNHRSGLYTGEESFLDWREQTYPPWTADTVVHIGMSETLSTNCLHYAALRETARLAGIAGDTEDQSKYTQWADDLRTAVNQRFALPGNDLYSSMRTTYLDNTPARQFDLLGHSLAVLLDIVDDDTARKMVSSWPNTDAGPPVIWPQQPDVPVYHNRGIWPFVTALYLRAAGKTRNAAVFNHAAQSLICGAALNLSNMENFEFTTLSPWYDDGTLSGPVVNSRRQLWSVAGYLSMVINGLFGITPAPEGLTVNPAVPALFLHRYFPDGGTVILTGLSWRDATVDVTLELPAPAADSTTIHTASSLMVNGEARTPGTVSAADLSVPLNTVTVTLGGTETGSSEITLRDCDNHTDCFAPAPVVLDSVTEESGELSLSWNDSQAGVTYHIFRNGQEVAENIVGDSWTDPDSANCTTDTCCYSIAAEYTDSGTISHHADPQCWWGTSYERVIKITADGFDQSPTASDHGRDHFADWGTPGDLLTVSGWSPPETAVYLLQLEYGSGRPIDTGITACSKIVTVTDETNGGDVLSDTVFMPHLGGDNWDRWGDSSFVRVELRADRSYTFTIADALNMSYFDHFSIYSAGAGGGSTVYNRVNLSTVKLLLWSR